MNIDWLKNLDMPYDVLGERGEIVIINGDCLKVLAAMPKGCVDAVVTDPPYGVGLGVDNNPIKDRTHLGKKGYDNYDDSYENFVSIIVPRINAALDSSVRGAVFSGPHIHEQRKPIAIGGVLIPAATGRTPWGSKNLSPILFYNNPRWPGRHRPTMLVDATQPEQNGHPCPKPLSWMNWLVHLASEQSESILDPFLGSGTTLVACVRTGRRGIGIEIDPGYYQIAKRRILAELAQPRLPFAEQPKAEQADMFPAAS